MNSNNKNIIELKKVIKNIINEARYFSNRVNIFKNELFKKLPDSNKLNEILEEYEHVKQATIRDNDIEINLYMTLTDEMNDDYYPIDDARIIFQLDNNDTILKCDIYVQINQEYRNNTFRDLKNNTEFNGVIIHELHHIISSKHLWLPNMKNEDNKQDTFFNLIKFDSEDYDFRQLMYYISKSELNSIIPQVNSGAYKNSKELFTRFFNMGYSDFEKIFNENAKVKLNKKMYDKIMDRIKYFLRKTR